jgi:hypothetical protein
MNARQRLHIGFSLLRFPKDNNQHDGGPESNNHMSQTGPTHRPAHHKPSQQQAQAEPVAGDNDCTQANRTKNRRAD